MWINPPWRTARRDANPAAMNGDEAGAAGDAIELKKPVNDFYLDIAPDAEEMENIADDMALHMGAGEELVENLETTLSMILMEKTA